MVNTKFLPFQYIPPSGQPARQCQDTEGTVLAGYFSLTFNIEAGHMFYVFYGCFWAYNPASSDTDLLDPTDDPVILVAPVHCRLHPVL